MPSYAGPSASRSGDIAGSLRLLAYLALAVILIVLDHRGGWLSQWRAQADLLVQPLWAVAGWPGQAVERISEETGLHVQVADDPLTCVARGGGRALELVDMHGNEFFAPEY